MDKKPSEMALETYENLESLCSKKCESTFLKLSSETIVNALAADVAEQVQHACSQEFEQLFESFSESE